MTRFAVVYEDPSYEEPEDIMDWLDSEIDGNSAAEAAFKRIADELSPFETINS